LFDKKETFNVFLQFTYANIDYVKFVLFQKKYWALLPELKGMNE